MSFLIDWFMISLLPLSALGGLGGLELPADSSFVRIMIEMKEMVIQEAQPLVDIAAMIACIGGIITTVKVCSGIMNGHQFSLWEIFRPLVVIAVCFNFNFVTKLLDIVPNGVSNIATAMVRANMKEENVYANLTKLFSDLAKAENDQKDNMTHKFAPNSKTDQTILGELGEDFIGPVIDPSSTGSNSEANTERVQIRGTDDDGTKTFWQKCGGFLKSVWGVVNDSMIANCAQWLCGIMNFVFPIVIGIAQIMLCILSFLGPFALAFCNFPGLGGFQTWLLKYIHTSFWMPITSILYFIDIVGMDRILRMKVLMGSVGDTLRQLGGNITAIVVFNIAMLFAIFKVPTYANYVMDSAISSGMGGALQKVKQIATMVVTKGKGGSAGKNLASKPKG